MGHFLSWRAFGRWIRDGFRQRTRSYRWENFPIHCAAQAVVIFMLVHYHILNGSMPEPFFVIGALLFSFLFWRVPTGDYRRNQLYLVAQTLIACLGFFQDFLFIYLFLLLVGQGGVSIQDWTRAGLDWRVCSELRCGAPFSDMLKGRYRPWTEPSWSLWASSSAAF